MKTYPKNLQKSLNLCFFVDSAQLSKLCYDIFATQGERDNMGDVIKLFLMVVKKDWENSTIVSKLKSLVPSIMELLNIMIL